MTGPVLGNPTGFPKKNFCAAAASEIPRAVARCCQPAGRLRAPPPRCPRSTSSLAPALHRGSSALRGEQLTRPLTRRNCSGPFGDLHWRDVNHELLAHGTYRESRWIRAAGVIRAHRLHSKSMQGFVRSIRRPGLAPEHPRLSPPPRRCVSTRITYHGLRAAVA